MKMDVGPRLVTVFLDSGSGSNSGSGSLMFFSKGPSGASEVRGPQGKRKISANPLMPLIVGQNLKMKKFTTLGIVLVVLLLSGCMRYLTHDRSEVLLDKIDMDQTLVIAEYELSQDKWGRVLTLWAIRDQKLTRDQAEKINSLYFSWIPFLDRQFNIWHLTWAISNMYRLGNEPVQKALEKAYQDATKRAANLHGLADKHANDTSMYFGDAHIGGRRYAETHLVVPGNENYLQSIKEFDEFTQLKEKLDYTTGSGEQSSKQ